MPMPDPTMPLQSNGLVFHCISAIFENITFKRNPTLLFTKPHKPSGTAQVPPHKAQHLCSTRFYKALWTVHALHGARITSRLKRICEAQWLALQTNERLSKSAALRKSSTLRGIGGELHSIPSEANPHWNGHARNACSCSSLTSSNALVFAALLRLSMMPWPFNSKMSCCNSHSSIKTNIGSQKERIPAIQ
jgi:hypothetical protein